MLSWKTGPITTFTPICFNSNADLSALFALEDVSLGIISIELLLISFTASLTALIIDCPSSLFDPDNGTKRPIFIFSEALAENENNKEKFSIIKIIILINLLILMLV
jgi:hypothetical protein